MDSDFKKKQFSFVLAFQRSGSFNFPFGKVFVKMGRPSIRVWETQSAKSPVCCNPFKKKNHNCRAKRAVTEIVVADSKLIKRKVKLGSHICNGCRCTIARLATEKRESKRKSAAASSVKDFLEVDVKSDTEMNVEKEESEVSASEMDVVTEEHEERDFVLPIGRKKLFESLNGLLTVLNIHTVSKVKLRNKSFGKKVLDELYIKLSKHLLGSSVRPDNDGNEMIQQLKEKFVGSNDRNEKCSVLSVLPKSWNSSKIQSEFGATRHMAEKVKKLVKRNGILSSQQKRISPTAIKPTTIAKVKDFFEDDEISRPCAGKNEYVGYKENMIKITKQRRFVLMNLREAYELFKEKYPQDKIGFTKFTMYRPPYCTLALESYGTHTTCVCIYHQNVVLNCDALKGSNIWNVKDYKDLFKIFLCDEPTVACYLLRCAQCPGKQAIAKKLRQGFVECDIEEVVFKQWITNTKGRCSLETLIRTTDVFISEFTEDIAHLVTHDFICRKQIEYLKYRKDALKPNEAVVVCDFSENFSFVIQDEVKGYHWNQQQCTIHPFVIYFRSTENGPVENQTFTIIAESLKHDFCSVWQFQLKLFEFLKEKLPNINRLYFFSDGAGGEYKNRKNFFNIGKIKSNFGYDVTWEFFGSHHGKNSCDAVGGTLKRNATKASLQRPLRDQITDAKKLFEWCTSNVNSKVAYAFCKSDEYEQLFEDIHAECANTKKITGTRQFHSFEPLTDHQIKTRIFSAHGESKLFKLLRSPPNP